jgi:hypothetical protein
MTRCIYCGADIGHNVRMRKLDGRVFELIWWCGNCSGKSWDWGVNRAYGSGPYSLTTLVPEGSLFVAASTEL